MLRWIYIALAFHVFFMSLGIKIEKHFCGQQVQSVKLFEHQKACCSSQDTQLPACCHNDASLLTLEDGVELPSYSFVFQTFVFFFNTSFPYSFLDEKKNLFLRIVYEKKAFAPPPVLSSSKLYLKYQHILI